MVFSFMLKVFSGGLLQKYGMAASTDTGDELDYTLPYIGVLDVNGTIQSDSGSELTTQSYHHSWTLKKIDQLKSDSNNRGLIIAVNTPGGGVYESDELYLAIKDYKETTGRPVYSYMKSQATSGGYYISAPCDKIIANRNCWTGSIGVTIGTMYDITGLLKKYGVKTVTITSGKNKAMGSYTNELTEEQQEILQSLVDEAYEQFVGIVAEGRGMSVKDVKKLADGRIYTAKQAKANGLIDEIATYDEAVDDMKKRFELDSCVVNEIKYKNNEPLLYRLLMETAELGRSREDTELDGLKSLMEQNGRFTVTYISEIQK
ncbi:MAG: signal peptide peptidase SppA [Eubacterium sp.]|nr:signal peptide peptidase SppA [Eubacterium sp.]